MTALARRLKYTPKILTGLIFLSLAGVVHAEDLEMKMGDVSPGTVRPLKLTAKNANCEAPQDFRIKLSNESWFHMSGPTVLSGIPAGGSQSSELLMDFANLEPGKYSGSVAIVCESCGWWIFTSCTANDQKVDIEFRIPKPSARNPGRYDSFTDAMNDVAVGNVNVPLGPPQWIEWDNDNNEFIFPPGQRPQGSNNAGQTIDLPEDFVLWFDNNIPHVGEPEDFPYPPSPIGGDGRYPENVEIGGITWDEWRPGIGARYTEDDVDRPVVPPGRNEPRIGVGVRYTEDDLDSPPPTPPGQSVPPPKPDPIIDRNGDGKVDENDWAIILAEAFFEARYGIPIKYLLPDGRVEIPSPPPKEPKSPARFVEGDLNGDGKFDNSDIIKGLQGGQYGPPQILPPVDDFLGGDSSDDKKNADAEFEKEFQALLDDLYADEIAKALLEALKDLPPMPPMPGTPPDPKFEGFGHGNNFGDGRAIEGPIDPDNQGGRLGTTEPGDTYPGVPGDRNRDGIADPKPKPKAVIFQPPVDFEGDMPGRDLKNLREKRLECIKKTAAVAGAQSDLSNKAKKASDCAKKLAALKAALDQAKVGQASAEKASKDAADHAANYEADLEAAQKASRMAVSTMQIQAAAHMSFVREKDAGNPQPAAEAHAKTQVDKAVEAVDAASRAVSAVKNSKKARDAAARDAAKAAKAAAKKAKDAQKAYDKQKALCQPLIKAASAAKTTVTVAEANLDKCKSELKTAEAAAPGQAMSNLQDKLNKAKGRKQGCQRDMDKYARELGQAFKALRLLGVLRPPKEELKTDRKLNDAQEFYGALFATGAAKATNVATFEVFAALDALKAGYGIYKIKNSSLIPLSSRFVRSESVKWLTETKGIADSPKEAEAVIKVMEGIIERNGKTDHIRENWERMQKQCKENDEDIKRLEARIAKLGK